LKHVIKIISDILSDIIVIFHAMYNTAAFFYLDLHFLLLLMLVHFLILLFF